MKSLVNHSLAFLLSSILLLSQFNCAGKHSAKESLSEFTCDYLNQTKPGLVPKPFAPEIFSSKGEYQFKLHSSLIFSPSGKQIVFVNQSFPVVKGQSKELFLMRQKNEKWSDPEKFPIAGQFSVGSPKFSDDGNRLYFGSVRPLSGDGEPKDNDIWYVDRLPGGWSEPENLGSPVNSRFNEWGFSFAKNGTVFFGRDSENKDEGYDIYMSVFTDDQYQEPRKLGPSINTEFSEGAPCIDSDERYLIFYRTNRANRAESGLYISFKKDDGSWTKSQNISDTWNLPRGLPFCTTITPDGKYIFILNRMDGIYWVDAKVINDLHNN